MNTPFTPCSLVACYARDSGGETQELSVPQQLSAFQSFCDANGLIQGAVFQDAARPGSSTVGRAGFLDMMHHFRHGAQEAGLVIWSYSRFARDIDDSTFYRADLRRRGYILHSLNDSIPEGNIGRLFEAVIDWKNSTFLEDLSRDTRRGLHDLVRVHGAVPGVPPRGFARKPVTIGKRRDGRDRIAHRWVPDPETAPKVAQAFAMRAAGRTLVEIQSTTHLFGSINSYKTFFTNRLYIGILDFGDQAIESYCEPIVDQATWDAVQVRVKHYAARANLKGPNHPRRVNSSYLLSGLVFCARCGSPLFGAPAAQRGGSCYERYACARAYRRRDCDQGQFPQGILDKAVLDTLREYVLQPDVLAMLQLQIQADRNGRLVRIGEQRTITANNLVGVRRRIANLTEAIAESGHTRALLDKLAGLEVEESAQLSEIADLDRQAREPAPDYDGGQLGALAEQVRAVIEGEDKQAKQRMLRGFVDRISVDRDGNKIIGIIQYYFPTRAFPEDTVSMPGGPLGAPLHTHRFTVEFTARMRAYKKRS